MNNNNLVHEFIHKFRFDNPHKARNSGRNYLELECVSMELFHELAILGVKREALNICGLIYIVDGYFSRKPPYSCERQDITIYLIQVGRKEPYNDSTARVRRTPAHLR